VGGGEYHIHGRKKQQGMKLREAGEKRKVVRDATGEDLSIQET